MLQPKCVASGSSTVCPIADSYSRSSTFCGLGRNSGGSQRSSAATHHSANRITIVTIEISVLLPSPGVE